MATVTTCLLPNRSASGPKINWNTPKGIMYAVIRRPALTGSTPIPAAIEGRMGETTQLSAMTTNPDSPRTASMELFFMARSPSS